MYMKKLEKKPILLSVGLVVFESLLYFVSKILQGPAHIMNGTIDNAIPFCVYFIIPYCFWYLLIFYIPYYCIYLVCHPYCEKCAKKKNTAINVIYMTYLTVFFHE